MKRILGFAAVAALIGSLGGVPAFAAHRVSSNGCDATLAYGSVFSARYVVATCGGSITNAKQAQGSIDCTAAPDMSTAWIGPNGRSASAACSFGARGVYLSFR